MLTKTLAATALTLLQLVTAQYTARAEYTLKYMTQAQLESYVTANDVNDIKVFCDRYPDVADGSDAQYLDPYTVCVKSLLRANILNNGVVCIDSDDTADALVAAQTNRERNAVLNAITCDGLPY